MTDALTMYLSAALGLIEGGWITARDHNSAKGIAVFTRGAERVEFRRAFNGGKPLWSAVDYPVRLCASLPTPFLTPDAESPRTSQSRSSPAAPRLAAQLKKEP